MTKNKIVSTLDVNFALFRDWQNLPREVFEMLGNRTSIGNLLVYKFHYDILDNDYTIIDDNEEIQHEEEMTPELVADVNEKYAKARKAFKQYGYSILSYYKWDDTDNKTLYWLEDTHIYNMDVTTASKKLKELKFVPPYHDRITEQNSIEVPAKELDNFRLLANYDTKINQYRSWLEPIADRLIGWAILFQQLTLLEIRDGSGIRYLLAPASHLADPKKRKEYEDILENMGYNTLLALPDDSELGKTVEFGIKFAEGQSAVNYSEALDMHLVPIALHTGLTKEYLKGNEMGLRSSEKNRQKSNEAETKEQKKMASDLLWIYGKIFDCADCLEGNHKINYDIKEELDETEKLQNLKIAFDILNNTNPEKLGVEMEDLLELLNVDIPFNPALMQEYKDRQEQLNESISKGIQDDTNNGTGENTEEEEEIQGEEE